MLITALLATLLPSSPPLAVSLAETASVSYATSNRLDWERPRFVLRAGLFGAGIVRGHAAVFVPAPSYESANGEPMFEPGGSVALGVRIPIGPLSVTVEGVALLVVDTFAPERLGVGAFMGGAVLDLQVDPGLGSERLFFGAGLDAGRGVEVAGEGWTTMIMPVAVTGIRAALSASMLVSATVRVGWIRGLSSSSDADGIPNVTAEFGLEL
jgi:hypothetical protein